MKVSLEEALDDCLQRLDTEGLAGCQARYPEQWRALEPLLTVAARLQAAVPPTMPAAARAAWKERLTAARPLAVPVPPRRVLRPGAARLRDWWPRLGGWRAAVALVVVLALLVGTWSAAAASRPGDPLYAAKLTQEDVGLWFVSGSAELAEAHFGLAERRTDEVAALAAQNRLAAAPLALSSFHDHLIRGLAAFALSLPAQRTTLATELKQLSDRAVTAFNVVTSDIAEDSALSASVGPLVQPALVLAQHAQEQAAQPQTILTPGPLTTVVPTSEADGATSPTAGVSPGATESPTVPVSPTVAATPTPPASLNLASPIETAVAAGTALAPDTPTVLPSPTPAGAGQAPTAPATAPPLPATRAVPVLPTATRAAPALPTATRRPAPPPSPTVRVASPTPRPKPSATRTPTPTRVPPVPSLPPVVPPTATPLPPVVEPAPTTVLIVPTPEPPPAPTATPEVSTSGGEGGGGNGKGNNGNGNGNGGGNGSNGGGNGNGNNGNGNGNGGRRTPTP